MYTRLILPTSSRTQVLRDILNNTGINDINDICVTEVMHIHQPNTEEELKLLLNRTGRMTLRQRVDAMWNAIQENEIQYQFLSKHNFTYTDAVNIVKTVLVTDTWTGFKMERLAVQQLDALFTGFQWFQCPKMDRQYKVDIAVKAHDGTVLGIQVKPVGNLRSANIQVQQSSDRDHGKQQKFKLHTGADTVYLYYDKATETFTNLDEVVARLNTEIATRYSAPTSTATTASNIWTSTST